MTDALLDVLTAQPSYGPALRRLICELAVTGRLLPQTSTWTEYRLEEIVSVRGGSTPSMARPEYWGGDVPWVSPKDMHVGDIVTSEMFVTQEALAKTSLELVPLGSVLIVGRSGILKRKLPAQVTRVACTVNQDIKALTPKSAIEPAYLRLWLLGSERAILAEDVKTGTTVQSLVFAKLFARRVQLPSMTEQRHIVAKVDELMALCDRLEAEQADAEAAHAKLVEALLTSLTQARNAAEFRASWQQLAEHFHTLFTTEASVDALRQTVLQLGVMGKLADQNHMEEPARKLLERLERDRRESAAALRFTDVKLSSLLQADSFELPSGWEWTTLASLFLVITDGDHQAPPRTEHGVAFLTIGNITAGALDFDGCRQVEATYYEALPPYRKPGRGDLLYTVVGATYGRPVLVDSDRPFCVQRHIAILKRSEHLSDRFALYLLKSPLVYKQASNCVTGTAQPTIPLRPLRNINVPLPPLAEQHRIVAKVDELLSLCDQLKLNIVQARQHHERLASAVVERSVA